MLKHSKRKKYDHPDRSWGSKVTPTICHTNNKPTDFVNTDSRASPESFQRVGQMMINNHLW